ncbi:GntR family transcriptional regulator [Microbacterium sp. cf332]|uniref:GntR family transcriptional regulator n=1 Tax=Microbacterium sp. cf332 TaxID=1761804 RepID=UPI00088BA28B|nr:GntR family transcriptional regulator [Microbacterium sp. cf332]SDQ48849.1 GntR family transcriptional regulator [Microbacterium sp. cf332]
MRIVLSTDSSTPIYEQVKGQVRAAILAGDAAPGTTLPSLRQLAADLRVSVITITRAYNDLVAEGLVRNEHGRGFVVLDVDPQRATAALRGRVDAALRELLAAARDARLTSDDIHRLIDETWRDS